MRTLLFTLFIFSFGMINIAGQTPIVSTTNIKAGAYFKTLGGLIEGVVVYTGIKGGPPKGLKNMLKSLNKRWDVAMVTPIDPNPLSPNNKKFLELKIPKVLQIGIPVTITTKKSRIPGQFPITSDYPKVPLYYQLNFRIPTNVPNLPSTQEGSVLPTDEYVTGFYFNFFDGVVKGDVVYTGPNGNAPSNWPNTVCNGNWVKLAKDAKDEGWLFNADIPSANGVKSTVVVNIAGANRLSQSSVVHYRYVYDNSKLPSVDKKKIIKEILRRKMSKGKFFRKFFFGKKEGIPNFPNLKDGPLPKNRPIKFSIGLGLKRAYIRLKMGNAVYTAKEKWTFVNNGNTGVVELTTLQDKSSGIYKFEFTKIHIEHDFITNDGKVNCFGKLYKLDFSGSYPAYKEIYQWGIKSGRDSDGNTTTYDNTRIMAW